MEVHLCFDCKSEYMLTFRVASLIAIFFLIHRYKRRELFAKYELPQSSISKLEGVCGIIHLCICMASTFTHSVLLYTYPSSVVAAARAQNSPEIGADSFAILRLPRVRAVIRDLFDSSFIH